MSDKKLARTIQRQVARAAARQVERKRQYLVVYVLEDGSLASAIMLADALTADEVNNIEYAVSQRHQKLATIMNLIELERPGTDPVVSLPAETRRSIQQLLLDNGAGDRSSTETRENVLKWLEEIGHPIQPREE